MSEFWFQAVDPDWAALALLLFVVLMSNIQLRPNPAYQSCKFCVFGELSSHFRAAVGPLVHQHHHTAVEGLFA